MENNITVNMENLSEEEREWLMKLIHKSNESKGKVWKPYHRDRYFYINECGEIMNSEWFDDSIDISRYGIGNCFKTKEEAEFALEKRRVEVELQRFAEENNECDTGVRYFISYNLDSEITVDQIYGVRLKGIYFSSKEVAENAIWAIGKGRLKKYYLGIED